jgi:hypothetical protein
MRKTKQCSEFGPFWFVQQKHIRKLCIFRTCNGLVFFMQSDLCTFLEVTLVILRVAPTGHWRRNPVRLQRRERSKSLVSLDRALGQREYGWHHVKNVHMTCISRGKKTYINFVWIAIIDRNGIVNTKWTCNFE